MNLCLLILFRNKKDQCLIVDNSIMLHSFKQQDYELFHHGRINFGWNGVCKDYDSPRAYNMMYLTDYGVDFYYLNDSIIIFPVNLIDRFVSEKEIESDRYDKLHIFGELNVNTMMLNVSREKCRKFITKNLFRILNLFVLQ